MIVIAIIGILAAAIFPTVSGYFARARDAKRYADVRALQQAFEQYYIDMERYPFSLGNGYV
jgi:type II secretory pathway pseudopilin PulG